MIDRIREELKQSPIKTIAAVVSVAALVASALLNQTLEYPEEARSRASAGNAVLGYILKTYAVSFLAGYLLSTQFKANVFAAIIGSALNYLVCCAVAAAISAQDINYFRDHLFDSPYFFVNLRVLILSATHGVLCYAIIMTVASEAINKKIRHLMRKAMYEEQIRELTEDQVLQFGVSFLLVQIGALLLAPIISYIVFGLVISL